MLLLLLMVLLRVSESIWDETREGKEGNGWSRAQQPQARRLTFSSPSSFFWLGWSQGAIQKRAIGVLKQKRMYEQQLQQLQQQVSPRPLLPFLLELLPPLARKRSS